MNLRKRDSLIIFWDKNKVKAWSLSRVEKKVNEIPSLDEVKAKEYRRSILILGRNSYIFKVAEFPNLKKNLIDKAIQTNITIWSPFQNNKFFYISYPKGNKVTNFISILKREDYDEIINQLKLKGIKIDMAIPESFCYHDFFKGKANAVGVVKKEEGMELIHFDGVIKESQFIPNQKWNRDSFDYFIKRIGPDGLEIKNVLFIGNLKEENLLSLEGYSTEFIKTESEIEAILKGSEFFSSSIVRHFKKNRLSILNEEDLKYLRPGITIVFAGILLFYASLVYHNFKSLNYSKKELSSLKEKTLGLEDKLTMIDNLKRKVDSAFENVERYPSLLIVLSELQNYFPEDTYLMRYNFNKNKIEFTGITSKSSEIISRLHSSLLLTDIRFKSSIEKDRETGKEKFTIELNIKK